MPAEGNVLTKTATILIGQSLSGEVDIEGFTIVAVEMPTLWTAANLTFRAASVTGGTFRNVYDDAGTEVVVTAAADRIIGLDAVLRELSALRFLQIRSGTAAVPVNQAADRTLTLLLKA